MEGTARGGAVAPDKVNHDGDKPRGKVGEMLAGKLVTGRNAYSTAELVLRLSLSCKPGRIC